MKTTEAKIKYKSVELVCDGYFTKSNNGDRDNPPEDANYEIETIFWGDLDVSKLIFEIVDDLREIEKLCIEKLS